MRGGKRQGAGRRTGAKAILKKEFAAAVASAEQVVGDELTPLQFQLRIMRDESKPDQIRLAASALASPCIHKKLPVAIEHSGELNAYVRMDPMVKVDVPDALKRRIDALAATTPN